MFQQISTKINRHEDKSNYGEKEQTSENVKAKKFKIYNVRKDF